MTNIHPTTPRKRYFAWRSAHLHESHQVLVGRRWLQAGSGGLIAFLITLVFWPGRRVKAIAAMLGVALSSSLLMLGSGVWNALFPMLRRVDLPVLGLPPDLEGVMIGHISDMHYGMPLTRAAVRKGLEAIQEAKPDVIVFTGDFVSYARYLRELSPLLAGLHAPSGMYACNGNHDHWAGLARVARMLDDCGIRLLTNEHRTLAIRDARLVIAGVDDLWDGAPDLDRALAGAPLDAPVVLLAHAPDYADIAARRPVMLQLAGHSHGGHIRLPWLGALLLPRHGIRYDRGLHRLEDMWLYVSHGLGGWPLRIGCRAEVTLLTLRRV